MSAVTVGMLVVFCFGVFLAAREFLCWYWKINKVVALLESIDGKLGPAGKTGRIPPVPDPD